MTLMKTILPAVAASAAMLLGGAVHATVAMSSWTPLYQGIEFATAHVSGAGIDLQQAQALRVDLTAPGIGFVTTPPGGKLNTVAETTSQFLKHSNTQLAINANFFAPCCNAAPEDKTVIGLAISNGILVAPAVISAAGAGSAVLLLTKGNLATITSTTHPVDLSGVYNAVAGSGIIVDHGADVSASQGSAGDPLHANPRTDVGISQDGRFLYLVTIDGRQPGYSIGATMAEAADLMIDFGAYEALNLDGGGSTTMVQSDGKGGAIDLNRPSGGAERFDANALGIFALPLPEPGSLGLLAVGVVALMAQRRRLA